MRSFTRVDLSTRDERGVMEFSAYAKASCLGEARINLFQPVTAHPRCSCGCRH